MTKIPAGLTQEDSETIGFVVTCLFSCAIDLPELHHWCYQIIRIHEVEAIPPYIFDLCQFEGPLADIFGTIGFVFGWERDKSDEAAIYGIAIRRGKQLFDCRFPKEYAIKALQVRPQMAKRFRETFHFIQTAQ